jgi:hypothetical protein
MHTNVDCKPAGNRTLGRPSHSCEDNIKLILEKQGVGARAG